ncbi:hypothetical protein GGS20DRAFT_583579 [Poronia punctata]|nr:hypothetical protein GGS20DRAFT_583579 [Poronia punctata]
MNALHVLLRLHQSPKAVNGAMQYDISGNARSTPDPVDTPTANKLANMSSAPMNKYWIPQLDINRKIITQELQYHLGPEATVRPYTRQGEDGFLITAPGACLTDEQIDDICVKSRETWERAAARAQQNPDKPLKRPLHQPVLISNGSGDKAKRRNNRGAVTKRGYNDRRGHEPSRNQR